MKTRTDINIVLLFFGLLIVAVLFMLFGLSRVNPGGPYIHILGEVIPLLILLFFLFIEIKLYMLSNLKSRVWILFLASLTVLLIGFILFNNLIFWLNPYSRGRLFGL